MLACPLVTAYYNFSFSFAGKKIVAFVFGEGGREGKSTLIVFLGWDSAFSGAEISGGPDGRHP